MITYQLCVFPGVVKPQHYLRVPVTDPVSVMLVLEDTKKPNQQTNKPNKNHHICPKDFQFEQSVVQPNRCGKSELHVLLLHYKKFRDHIDCKNYVMKILCYMVSWLD